jgi:molybdopterin/thiamine biosynthesis adenylyltransferase
MLKPRIKLSHQVLKSANGNLCIGEAGPHTYMVKKPPSFFYDFIILLDGTNTIPKIIRHLQNKFPDIEASQIKDLLEKMKGLHLLEDGGMESENLSLTEQELYNRQILLFSLLENKGKPGHYYQNNIKNKHVVILGLGGWGTWLALNLSLAGVGELTIVDGDTVELSNLNRQVLYSHEDIGQPKAFAAKNRLQKINPYIKVNAYNEFINKDEIQIKRIIEAKDLILIAWANLSYYRRNCVDEIIHKIAIDFKTPILEVNADPLDISIGPFYLNNGKSVTFFDICDDVRKKWLDHSKGEVAEFRKSRMIDNFYNGNRICNAWQQASSLSVMAGIASSEILKFLGGYAEPALIGKEFALNLMTFESRIVDFQINFSKRRV